MGNVGGFLVFAASTYVSTGHYWICLSTATELSQLGLAGMPGEVPETRNY